ncbi:hypothetical protein SDC9_71854 [bioreactor metagenome]|uniref:HTH hxlR-type domain-containing protein n=1 Tax=bioreactor metagenome TaxID=1076179 RepID=A0A644YFR3_9ZZZZ
MYFVEHTRLLYDLSYNLQDTMDIWEILQQKHTAVVLIYIFQNPNVTQTKFMEENMEGQRSKYQRLKMLVDKGLVIEENNPIRWNVLQYRTTNEGERIAKLLMKIESGEEDAENYPTSEKIRNMI